FTPPRAKDTPARALADAFDLRIITLLAFGLIASVLALSAISGRGTVPMWGCPLWLFLGLWVVLVARSSLDDRRLFRVVATWAAVFASFALGFFLNYAVLPYYDLRY